MHVEDCEVNPGASRSHRDAGRVGTMSRRIWERLRRGAGVIHTIVLGRNRHLHELAIDGDS